MKELYLIESLSDVKSVFGSLSIIENIDSWDQIQVVKFAKIVNNYIKMSQILKSE